MYRFLLSGRWLRLIVAALAAAAACVAFGLWQLDRFDQRQERNDLVRANLSAAPVDADEVMDVGRPLRAAHQWRRVEARGRYDESHEILVRNRPLNGSTGYYVLTPLVTDTGPTLLVNRGWVPVGDTARTRPDVQAPPSGEVTVVGRARPSEPGDGGEDAPTGQVRRIAVPAIAASLPYDVYGGYADLVEQTPPAGPSPIALPAPEPGSGPHLAYAFQWFVFAVIAVGGVVVLARREAREARSHTPVPEPTPVSG